MLAAPSETTGRLNDRTIEFEELVVGGLACQLSGVLDSRLESRALLNSHDAGC